MRGDTMAEAEGTSLGTAYVQIMPSAKGIKGNIEKVLGGEAESAGKSAGSKIAGAFGGAMKSLSAATASAIGAAGSGIAAVAKSSFDSFANYEQLVGGVETLFDKSADTVKAYADSAYQRAGMSANEYMETVTSFSASLLQGLGGDTETAAKVADKAIVDMSDNANKMGTDISLIQNAYQGFAKQNYTMLDNLKLGKQCHCRAA